MPPPLIQTLAMARADCVDMLKDSRAHWLDLWDELRIGGEQRLGGKTSQAGS